MNSEQKKILGIDPGLGGALAFLHADGALEIFDMPVHRLKRGGKAKREIDRYELARLVDAHGPVAHAFVEQVGAMPKQGVTSMFPFGRSLGIVEGVLSAGFIPTDYVAPRKWRSGLGVDARSCGTVDAGERRRPGRGGADRALRTNGTWQRGSE